METRQSRWRVAPRTGAICTDVEGRWGNRSSPNWEEVSKAATVDVARQRCACPFGAIRSLPRAITAFKTESTDDAYVNGHVTFVAPRVPGQVVRVLVDDNNRVRKGHLIVQLDKDHTR